MTPSRIVFFGSPDIAVTVLAELAQAGIVPSLIVTTPDAPAGRGRTLTPPPVKTWAHEHEVPVLQPDSLKAEDEIAPLLNTEWDLFLVAAYGGIIPKHILELPKHGTLNVHPSLLPKFRGPSPVRSAILADGRVTGVTIMLMDAKLDHGPIVAQARVEIPEEEWPLPGRMLDELLAHAGGELLADTIRPWCGGEITPEEQDHERATYTNKLTKDMGELELDLRKPPTGAAAHEALLKIRAFDGWPGTFLYHTDTNGKKIRVKIIDAELADDGSLTINTVQPEGRRPMPLADFLRAH